MTVNPLDVAKQFKEQTGLDVPTIIQRFENITKKLIKNDIKQLVGPGIYLIWGERLLRDKGKELLYIG
ncbi:hypothetical protein [Cohnella abietis]|uniref:Uncharacterized protein n=1 Tax=Cohnella abietis TaxID=2507935 RepID=A0A3T1CY10_9BACL|nr:hypothetical protein [Cohnella abietis]BBI30726.1 hypothetical protein KCTCHS21_01250 [Cohnella abietis]